MFNYQRTVGKVFYRMTKELVNMWCPYFLMKADSILFPKVEKTLTRLTETGITRGTEKRHFPKPLKSIEEEPLKPLALDSFMLGFIVWAIGLAAALVVFLTERYWKP